MLDLAMDKLTFDKVTIPKSSSVTLSARDVLPFYCVVAATNRKSQETTSRR